MLALTAQVFFIKPVKKSLFQVQRSRSRLRAVVYSRWVSKQNSQVWCLHHQPTHGGVHMIRRLAWFAIQVGAGLALCLQTAHAVNKCTAVDGSVSFQDAPCPRVAKKAETFTPKETSGGFEHPFARRSTKVDRVIRQKCALDWPDDFRMRAFCEKSQYKALLELSQR